MDRPPASDSGFPPRSSFVKLEFKQSILESARLALPPTRFHDSPSDVSCTTHVKENNHVTGELVYLYPNMSEELPK